MEWSEQSDKISAALLAAQRELGPVHKDGKNPHFKSTYATLNAVWETCAPVLHSHDLFVVQAPANGDGNDKLITEIRHKSGQWVRGTLRLNPVKNDPQGIGSAITYARRYSLCAMLGLMQEDDDGNAASAAPRQQPQRRPEPKPQPAAAPATTIDEDTPILVSDTDKTRIPAAKLSDRELVDVHEWYRGRYVKTQKEPAKSQLKAVVDMLEACAEARGVELIPF